MPTIPEPEAIRKAQTIGAGMRAIAGRDCANATMDDVCRADGLSKGRLARYASSKSGRFQAVFQEFFLPIFQRGRDTMGRFDGPLVQVLSFDRPYDRDNPDMGNGYPLLFDFMAIAVRDRGEGWPALLHGAPSEGVACGPLTGPDPQSTARTVSDGQVAAVAWKAAHGRRLHRKVGMMMRRQVRSAVALPLHQRPLVKRFAFSGGTR